MLTPDFAKPEDLERYEAFMDELVDLIVDKYDGSLKAEHGTGVNMAPYVEREWGEKATEMMWRIKELADPGRRARARASLLNRDPGVHLRNLKTTPPIEEVGDHLRRVRLLRAGLPEPRPDDDAAPADRRCAARWRASPRARRCSRRCSSEYEYDAIETCAADGTLRARLPGRDRHRQAGQGAPRAAARPSAAERAALGVAKRWDAVERAARGGLRAGPRSRRAAGDAPSRGMTRRRAGASARARPEWAAAMPPPAPRELPPTTPRGRRRRLLARLHQPDLRPPARRRARPERCPRRWSRSRRAPGCRSGSPPTSPATAARRRGRSKGYERGAELHGQPDRRARSGAGAARASCRWSIDASSCTHGLASSSAPACSRREPRAARAARGARLDRVGARRAAAASSRSRASSARSPSTRPARPATSASRASSRRSPARSPTRSSSRSTPTCCGFAGDRGFLHPELTASATARRGATRSRGRDVRRLPVRATAPARSGWSARPASATSRSCTSLEELTR